MSIGGVTERLNALCARVDFDLASVDDAVLRRLSILADGSQTVDDLERMSDFAFAIFDHYEDTRPHEAFQPIERATVVLGCLFSDIGKTGPRRADEGDRRLIVDMFSIEGVRDETQSVRTFFHRFFPADADDRVRRFEALGLNPDISIRQFWNMHTGWTLEIIEDAGVPPEAVAAAATHHLLDDINPDEIVGSDHRFTRRFGENTCFDRAEKLVILLDKYDALRRRGGLDHRAAIKWLRERISNNARFRGDRELETLLGDIDDVLSNAA